MMARARGPLVVAMSGAFRSACACWRAGHSPDLTPIAVAALPARDAGGPSGARRPLPVAATARRADCRRVR